ncbi:MAG: hypothetical protein KIG53_03070 [Oscillospiraceae bacterium]|nr:hypothetical protein [Oscillospiraceae bacterium]
MNTILIRQIKMPLTIRAFTVPDANGDFNIYINEDLSPEQKQRSLEHEKLHIKYGHFSASKPVNSMETEINSNNF